VVRGSYLTFHSPRLLRMPYTVGVYWLHGYLATKKTPPPRTIQ
jgi:hypothetical protein